MCDEHSLNDMTEHLRETGRVTRRHFGAMTAGAALIATLPRAANALAIKGTDVTIKTPDGTAEAYFVAPTTGKHPGVLVWVDAFGLRPAFKQMADRLAESGYAVLVPNPYYRTAKVPVLPEGLDFAKPDDRAQIMKVMSTLSPETHVTDAKAFVAYIDTQAQVDTKKKIGTTGYCMGGPLVMKTAYTIPGRIGAVGSFHGGGLATDKPDSPHLSIPKMKADFLICVADNDDKREPMVKDTLKGAFAAAKLAAEIEVYDGANHGWCVPGSAVYNEDAAEKAWARLLVHLKKALV